MSHAFLNKPVKRITAIDLGTNSFHAVIVDIYPDGGFYVVDKLKEMVLLAEKGVSDRLSDAAMERGLSALRKIKTLSDHQKSERILAYATSAIRESENGGQFIQRVIDEIGIKINAIPGRVEAELIGLAVQHGIQMPEPDEGPALIVDVGGGSVEFLIADKQKFYFLTSKKLGVARMHATIIDHDPITEKEIKALQKHYRESLTDLSESFAMNRASLLIGSSGTMENIALMIAYRNKRSPSLSLNELEFSSKEFYEFYEYAISLNKKKRSKLKGIDEKRIELLPAGLVLLKYILDTFAIKLIKISSQALREGIILRYIRRELKEIRTTEWIEDPRKRSVLELVHKCEWHEEHSLHVASLALSIFDAVKDKLKLTEQDRELLTFAAYMHDIGYHISHRKHHKHALYIIRNSDLMGFKECEIEIMANVARYHRRSTPKMRHPYYKRLDKESKNRVKKLSAILRVADGLDRSHYQNVRDVKIDVKKTGVELYLSTESDPHLEIWGANRKKALFEEIMGMNLTIQTG